MIFWTFVRSESIFDLSRPSVLTAGNILITALPRAKIFRFESKCVYRDTTIGCTTHCAIIATWNGPFLNGKSVSVDMVK